MSLHPNWVALSTVDFHRKEFIRANENVIKNNYKVKPSRATGTLNGSDAKDFYLNIISTPSTNIQPNPDERLNMNKSRIKITENKIEIEPTVGHISKFLMAAQNNNVKCLQDMYSDCVNILDSVDSFGWTALMCASQSGAVDSVRCLLNWKPNIVHNDRMGRTAVSVAKSKEIFSLLINYNDINNEESNEEDDSGDAFCEACNMNYKSNKLKGHYSSTLHIFNSGKREHPVVYGIPVSNKGYQLLLRTGWNRDNGLGPDGAGSKFPVKTVLKMDRYGLGAKKDIPKVTHFSAGDTKAVSQRRERQNTVKRWQRMKQVNREKAWEIKIRNELS